jgi:uncharacterized RDD family membrane protein YckC
MTTTADDYINRVLAALPRSLPLRSQIAMELRGHIAERVDSGHPLDDVLRQLGDPVTLAESYLSAEPLERAPFFPRALAKLVDVATVVVVLSPLVLVGYGLLPPEAAVAVLIGVLLIGGSIGFGLYTVFAEYAAGYTLGKKLAGLRVVRESGAPISLGQAVVRQLPMFLQVYLIDVMFALVTEQHQRAFELLSKTRVVVAAPSSSKPI